MWAGCVCVCVCVCRGGGCGGGGGGASGEVACGGKAGLGGRSVPNHRKPAIESPRPTLSNHLDIMSRKSQHHDPCQRNARPQPSTTRRKCSDREGWLGKHCEERKGGMGEGVHKHNPPL